MSQSDDDDGDDDGDNDGEDNNDDEEDDEQAAVKQRPHDGQIKLLMVKLETNLLLELK